LLAFLRIKATIYYEPRGAFQKKLAFLVDMAAKALRKKMNYRSFLRKFLKSLT